MKTLLYCGVTVLLIAVGVISFVHAEDAEEETPLLINEVAFRENNDWVELIALASLDLSDYELLEGGTVITDFPDLAIESGDFIVLHKESGADDVVIDDNDEGAWDFYNIGGLTATDNVLILRNVDTEEITDAVIWSNDNGSFTGNKTNANLAIEKGAWESDEPFSSSCDTGAWTDSDDVNEGFSIARDELSSDTNSLGDWVIMDQTPGEANIPNIPPEALFVITAKTLGAITFDASTSTDEDGEIISYVWDFGDGNNGEGRKTSHNFDEGEFIVVLEVTDDSGATDQYNKSVIIELDDEAEEEVSTDPVCDSLVLNEILPNPSGDELTDEFIEIKNAGSTECSARGWTLEDGGGSDYVITPDDFDSSLIPQGRFLLIYRSVSKIALNNNGESLDLKNPSGNTKSETSFDESAPDDNSLNFDGSSWVWSTTITPGEENIITEPNEPPEANAGPDIKAEPGDTVQFDGSGSTDPNEDELAYVWDFDDGSSSKGLRPTHSYSKSGTYKASLVVSDGELEDDDKITVTIKAASSDDKEGDKDTDQKPDDKKDDTKVPESLTVAQAREKDTKAYVKVNGLATVASDLFGKNIFYLQDGTAGIQIYLGKNNTAKISEGDQVEITGKTSTNQKEKKINADKEEGVKITGKADVPAPKEIKSGEASEVNEGSLVKFGGQIVKKSSSSFQVDDGSGEAKVSIKKSTDIKSGDYKKESAVSIQGIVSRTSNGYRVLPRSKNDITKGEVAGTSTAKDQSLSQIPATGTNTGIIIAIGAGIAFLVFLLNYTIQKIKSRKEQRKK